MVAALVVIALVEGFARDDVYWRRLAIFLAVAIAFVQLLRRSDPLLAASLAFGPSAVVQGVASLSTCARCPTASCPHT